MLSFSSRSQSATVIYSLYVCIYICHIYQDLLDTPSNILLVQNDSYLIEHLRSPPTLTTSLYVCTYVCMNVRTCLIIMYVYLQIIEDCSERLDEEKMAQIKDITSYMLNWDGAS